jgi:hypothetical protein
MLSHGPPEPSTEPLEADEIEIFQLPGSCHEAGGHLPSPGTFTLTDRWLRFTTSTSIASGALHGVSRGTPEAPRREKIAFSQIERVERRRRLVFFQEILVTLRDGRVLHLGGGQGIDGPEQALRERMNQP